MKKMSLSLDFEILKSKRDAEIFLNALKHPKQPNKALKNAVINYKNKY